MTAAAPLPPRRLSRATGSSVFGADATGYHGARLGYPVELYDAIRSRRGTGGAVLEIGPGTGLATADILGHLAPSSLVVVEADPLLAARLAEPPIDPRLRIVAQPFPEAAVSGSFDLACAAASFHWFDPVAGFARLRTLLRPGATVALWWNVYRQTGIGDAFADAVTPLISGLDLPPSEGVAGHYALDVDHHRGAMRAGGFTETTAFLFRRERMLDPEQVRALYASYSYVRALPPPDRVVLLDTIETLARADFSGSVTNVVLTPLYLATRADGED